MIKVYIASPYTIGSHAENVRKQMDVFHVLAKTGKVAPFAPLLFHFQHLVHPLSYDEWMSIDFAWVKACDCVLRLPGESKGADAEVEFAKTFQIPVFYSIEQVKEHYFLL